MGSSRLDELALKYGTDKSSQHHCYTFIYERFLAPLQKSNIKLLEIGIYDGASLKMWRDYLPNAQIHAIDIDPACSKHQGEGIRIHIGDQSDQKFLQEVVDSAGGEFDVIIDDGSHQVKHQILSLLYLFPHVKDRGIYFVEDLHTSYIGEYRDEGGQYPSFWNMVKYITDNFNVYYQHEKNAYVGDDPEIALPLVAIPGPELTMWQKSLYGMHVYPGICAFEKCRRYK